GKTSLALQVGHEVKERFRDGAFFVPLASVTDPDLVVPAIAQTLGLTDKGTESLLGSLQQTLSNKQVLLALDNFEQVLDASPAVAQLLATCPELKVLVTSREALHIPCDQQLPEPALHT